MVLMLSLRSRSSHGQGHFKVKVILESDGNVFQFLSQSRQLAFVQMLILLVVGYLMLAGFEIAIAD